MPALRRWTIIAPDGATTGPYTGLELLARAKRGEFAAGAMVWRSRKAQPEPLAIMCEKMQRVPSEHVWCDRCNAVVPLAESHSQSGSIICSRCVQRGDEAPISPSGDSDTGPSNATDKEESLTPNFVLRGAAVLLDAMLFALLAYPFVTIVKNLPGIHGAGISKWIGNIASILFAILYQVVSLTSWGATPGKRICGIAVVTLRGEYPDYAEAIIRVILRWLTLAVLGFAVQLVSFPLAFVAGLVAFGNTHSPVLGVLLLAEAGLWLGGAWWMLRTRENGQTWYDRHPGTRLLNRSKLDEYQERVGASH